MMQKDLKKTFCENNFIPDNRENFKSIGLIISGSLFNENRFFNYLQNIIQHFKLDNIENIFINKNDFSKKFNSFLVDKRFKKSTITETFDDHIVDFLLLVNKSDIIILWVNDHYGNDYYYRMRDLLRKEKKPYHWTMFKVLDIEKQNSLI